MTSADYINMPAARALYKEKTGESGGSGGNTGLPLGLCKKYGISLPENATPRQAWDELAKKGIAPPWTEKGKRQYEGGKHNASATQTEGEGSTANAKGDEGGTDSKGGGKEDAPDVVELDENSELMKRVEGLSRKERVKAVENYLREVLGGREIEFHDGIKATVTGRDANKLARDAYHAEKGMRRTAELAQVEKLIDAARYVKDGEVDGHNKDHFSKFRYYGVTTRYKGNDEVLFLNVGKNIYTEKYQFYAITSG